MITSIGSSHTTSSQAPAGTFGIAKVLSGLHAAAYRARRLPVASLSPTQHFSIGLPLWKL
jgi:hypothetical protein